MSRPSRQAIAQAQEAAGLAGRALPRHVAVIMDGNGRWAQQRTLARIKGHRQGSEAVRATVRCCASLGIEYLTLYAFSSENWRRPQREVQALMQLLRRFLAAQLPELLDHGIRLRCIGQTHRLPTDLQDQLAEAQQRSAQGDGMILQLALSYGGRDELVDAARHIARAVADGAYAAEAIQAEHIQQALYAPDAPDVDVIIRSAGELRTSNFLPWQSVYAEFVSIPEYWPDVGEAQMHRALQEYARRQRRFGAV